MIDKKTFKTAVNNVLSAANFRRQGQSWYLDGRDASAILNLQKSDYDDRYYVNFSIAIESLAINNINPGSHQIDSRLTAIFPEQAPMIEQGCSLSEGNPEFLAQFVTFLESEVVPFCSSCTELPELRNLFLSDRFRRALIRKDARALLTQDSNAN